MASTQGQAVRGRPFKKGQSGNPGGRPKGELALREAARKHCPEAIRRIAEIMRSSTDERVVIHAAEVLLERGYGKPVQAVAVSGDGEGGPISMQGLGPIYGLHPPAET